jgi:hypothetical protein
VIVIGSAAGSRSFLSVDKHAVYSEFTFHVDEVLKGKQIVSLGDLLTTTRFGGVVRFATGTTYIYRISKQGWPVTGRRYVLFLSKNQSDDFDIVTGYELRDGVAQALDGALEPATFRLRKYDGKPEPTLLNDIEALIQ